jgi:hypothetical protein
MTRSLTPAPMLPPRCLYAAPTLDHCGMWLVQTGQSCPPGIPLCPPINLSLPGSEEEGQR